LVQARALLRDPRALNDPLLEEVRRFYEENHEGIEASRQKHRYYYEYLSHLFLARIPEGQRVLDIGCGSGGLLAALKPSRGVGIDVAASAVEAARGTHGAKNLHFFEGDATDRRFLGQLGGPFDVILLVNVVTHLTDVQKTFESLHPLCHSRTRVFTYSYSRLWQPLLRLGEGLGLKYRQPPESWLPPEEIENMLSLADFEVVRRDRQIVFPLNVPGLADLLNRFVGPLPIIDVLSLMFGIVARPSPSRARRGSVQEPSTSIIVPCRNEAGHIRPLVESLPRLGPNSEFLFVEGNSTDDTEAVIKQVILERPDLPLRLLKQTGRGKGDAVRLGFAQARGEILLILDSDMGVAPADMPKFVEALVRGKGDMVNGSRMVYPMDGKAMRFLNLLANKFFAVLFSWLLGQQVRDTLCGTKALYREDYERIAANRSYFGDFDPFGDFDLLFGAARLNLRIVDLAVRYHERLYGETNISRWRHGWLLLRMSLFAARKLKFH
jgi:SAM-dependent methyltransferase